MADNRHKIVMLRMEEFRQDQSCTDVVMECRDGPVYAHKSILMASSEYFQAMFTTDLAEKISGRVQFPTASKDTVEIIVKYLYTSQIHELPEDWVSFRELLQMCHMLQLDELIKVCYEQKIKNLNAENFVDLWSIGVDFDCYKQKPMQRYLKNSIKTICREKTVQNLTCDHVAKLVECIDHKKYCSQCVRLVLEWKSGGEREEDAARLVRKIDLRYLNDLSLHNLLKKVATDDKEETVENVLVEEAVGRLATKNKIFENSVVEKYNKLFKI